jgi:hypothetical protein
VPESLFALATSLVDLRLSNNRFFAMPASLVALTALTRLDAAGNEWLNVTDALLQRRGKPLIKHFAPRLVPARRARLLVVGEGGVGKTALIRSLLNCNKKARSTSSVTFESDCVTVHRCRSRAGSAGSVDLTIWDLKHVDEYDLVAQQFFMTDECVVSVVFDLSRFSATRLYTCLSAIRARAPRAPVMLFGTHSEQVLLLILLSV